MEKSANDMPKIKMIPSQARKYSQILQVSTISEDHKILVNCNRKFGKHLLSSFQQYPRSLTARCFSDTAPQVCSRPAKTGVAVSNGWMSSVVSGRASRQCTMSMVRLREGSRGCAIDRDACRDEFRQIEPTPWMRKV